MGTEQRRIQSDSRNPLVYKASILPRADVIATIKPTWKQEILRAAAAADDKPEAQALTSSLTDLERNRRSGLLLDDRRPLVDLSANDNIADAQLNNVTATKLAVDRNVEHRPVSNPLLMFEVEAYLPDLLRLKRSLRPDRATGVPGHS